MTPRAGAVAIFFWLAACEQAPRPPAQHRASVVPRAAAKLQSQAQAWPTSHVRYSLTDDGHRPPVSIIPDCGSAAPLLTSDSIGPFYPTQPLESVARVCPALRAWNASYPGEARPVLFVRRGGATIEIELIDTLPQSEVLGLTVEGPSARTRWGVGLGSTWKELEAKLGRPGLLEARCEIEVVFAREPGLIWTLRMPGSSGWRCEEYTKLWQRPRQGSKPLEAVAEVVTLLPWGTEEDEPRSWGPAKRAR